MPRNGSGVYSLPSGNPVVSGSIIQSTWANSTLTDVADAITGSLARDGTGGMTGSFKVVDGSAGTPGLAFTNEPSSGFYRSGAGEVWASVLSSPTFQLSSTGLSMATSKVLSLQAGAVGAPALTFASDNNTGVWSPAADTVAISAGGSEKLRISTSAITITGATLNADTVAITGGTINATPIGGSTAAAGSFTTLNASSTTVVDVNSASTALRVTQSGTGNAFLIEDDANPDSTPLVVDADGNIVQGHTVALATESAFGNSLTPSLQKHGTNFPSTTIANTLWTSSAATNLPTFTLARSRSNTIGTNAIVLSGDNLGAVSFNGDDGAGFAVAASIIAAVDGTPGVNDMPGRLVFNTTADGGSNPTERFRISSFGGWGLAGANYGTSGTQAIVSNGNAAAPTWQDVATPTATQTLSNKTLASPTITGVATVAGGSASAPSITFSGDTNTGIYSPGADRIGFTEGGTQCAEFDASGNFKFNSGYGSVATAYGCRAWVNFNGTGTVSIRNDGNVTSISDNGTGDYTVNLTNSMPDANYAVAGAAQLDTSAVDNNAPYVGVYRSSTALSTGSVRVAVRLGNNTATDATGVYVAIFR